MPLELFKGVRADKTQDVNATGFDMREEYTGPLLSMIWKSMPDLNPSFQQFGIGLMKQAGS